MSTPHAIRKLRKWAGLLENSQTIMRVVSKSLAEESIGLIKGGFRAEVDPYGKRWKPKQRPDGRKTLSGKTSRLKGGWHVVHANAEGFLIKPSVDYASPHQRPKRGRTGKLKRPRRMMVPIASRRIPRRWRLAWDAAATDAMKAILGGRRGGTGGVRISIR